jgi:hypothetical protein
MPAHRERSSSLNNGGPALVTNGDYLTIRANPVQKQVGGGLRTLVGGGTFGFAGDDPQSGPLI